MKDKLMQRRRPAHVDVTSRCDKNNGNYKNAQKQRDVRNNEKHDKT